MTQVIIFEDEGYKNFLPLTWTRPVYALRCGINTLAEKIIRHYPKAETLYSGRYYLPGKKLMKFEKGLFINGRLLAPSRMAKIIPLKGPDEVFVGGGEVVAVRAVTRNFEEARKKGRVTKLKCVTLKTLWGLLKNNAHEILEDKKYLSFSLKRKVHKSVIFYNPTSVIIDRGAEIEANAVIDARSGPIYIGKGSIIRPFTYLRGPLTIGPMCRIGGEVSASIFHGYGNKQHYGFIGDSYIGEWVNLGAGTTNSNLKNNYGTVKVIIEGKKVDSREQFVGCFIGDHTKTGIGTLINTGATIGVAANIFGGGVTPKQVPSFNWGIKDKTQLNKALETIKAAMQRRGQGLSEEDERLMKYLYKHAS